MIDIKELTAAVGSPVRWLGAHNPELFAVNPVVNRRSLRAKWPESAPQTSARLRVEAAVAGMVIRESLLDLQALATPDPNSDEPVVKLLASGWVSLKFSSHNRFKQWARGQEPQARMGNVAGLNQWLFIGNGAVPLVAEVAEVPVRFPKPYEDLSLIDKAVVMSVSPLRNDFTDLLPPH